MAGRRFAAAAVGGGALPAANAAEGNALSGVVWWDLDHDGCVCAGEPGLGGVELVVTEAGDDGDLGTGDDVAHPPLTTDPFGVWTLDGLAPGLYRIEVTDGVPDELSQTYDPDDGTTGAPLTPYVADVEVPDQEDPLTVAEQDFGFAGDGEIGDFVWLDQDGDGEHDLPSPDDPLPVAESGLPGVDVVLTWHGPDGALGGGDDLTVTATTNEFGEYFVSGLPAGTYTVLVDGSTLPSGVVATSDPDGSADGSATFTLSDEEPFLYDIDFGYQGTSSIGDRVVWDVDDSGGISAADRGLVGVPVIAIWAGKDGAPETDDDVPFFTFTGVDGVYLFDGLPAGSYEVITLFGGPGFELTFAEDGGIDPFVDVELAAGSAHLSADFGFAGGGSIGDTVYFDDDGDGVQDAGEAGVPGQRVDLVWAGCDCEADTGDDIVISTTTHANGNYLFEHLFTGDEESPELYRVVVVGGVADTAVNTGDPDVDDPEGAPDESYTELYLDDDDLDQDFGYQRLGSIGGTVWLDVNRDGTQQPGEPGIAGLSVTLVSPEPAEAFAATAATIARTDAFGAYRFDQLPAGAYEVAVTPPASSVPTADADGGGDHRSAVSLAAGEANLTQSFGFGGTASLTGTVFNDTDRDGTPDPGEPGVPGVSVAVVWNGPNGTVVLTTTTGADGAWSLVGLPAGDYTVRLDPATVPSGFNATTPADVAIALAPGGAGSAVHGVAIQASPPVPPTTNPPATPDPGTLPATGGQSSGPATLAVTLLALGLAALGVASARRRDRPAT